MMVRRDKPPREQAFPGRPATDAPLWSLPVMLGTIPDDGRHFDLAADETVRAAITAAAADLANVRSISRMEAHFDVMRHGADGLRVKGRAAATVSQTCVVTLEPLDSEIREDIDLLFVPEASLPADPEDEPEEDGPEPLVNGTVDLGQIATDFLILGIDPYPRKPGAVFESPLPLHPNVKPFAALAALKKDRAGDES